MPEGVGRGVWIIPDTESMRRVGVACGSVEVVVGAAVCDAGGPTGADMNDDISVG